MGTARRALGAAKENIGVAGVERIFQIRLIEVSQLERTGFVDGAEVDEIKPLANARELGLARDDGADTGILAGDEVGDLDRKSTRLNSSH